MCPFCFHHIIYPLCLITLSLTDTHYITYERTELSSTFMIKFIFSWWRMTDSNRRPPPCKSGALPSELIPLLVKYRVARRKIILSIITPYKGGDPAAPSGTATLLRLSPPHKAHLRKLLPSRVSSPPSGALHSADLTGGVYKARERIHRTMMLRDY